MPKPDYDRVDYTGWEFYHSRPEYDWSRVTRNACFSQEKPDTVVFAPDTVGTFINCNMDNVLRPIGCTFIDCTQRRFMKQNCGRDWLTNERGEPIEVLNRKSEIMQGRSVDPRDIPEEPVQYIDAMRVDVLNGDVLLKDVLAGKIH